MAEKKKKPAPNGSAGHAEPRKASKVKPAAEKAGAKTTPKGKPEGQRRLDPTVLEALLKKAEVKKAKRAAFIEQVKELETKGEVRTVSVKRGAIVSPFAPAAFPTLPEIAGVRLAAAQAGVRYKDRTDVMMAKLAPGSVMAGTFTRSATRAAPVLWCEQRLAAHNKAAPEGTLGIVVNSGNANAFTGRNGMEATEAVMTAAAEALGTKAGNLFMSSTGVIGEPLPHARISAKLAELRDALAPGAWEAAARAIMTTDTYPKGATATVELDGVTVTVNGIAKGSGMVAPDMGTMLVYLFTDAAIARAPFQTAVSELTDQTFNRITVDGDTSTSDTLLAAATGQAAMKPIADRRDKRYLPFRSALGAVMKDLALQVVKDGEGASKFAAITVTGAESDRAAHRVGLSIANSPLVKTALAGADPNWGRIVMAVGKAGEKADRDKLAIRFGDILVAEQGWVAAGYREVDGAEYFKRDELDITVDLGVGKGRATVWTCDLTHRYIQINADYRS